LERFVINSKFVGAIDLENITHIHANAEWELETLIHHSRDS
jgi:hypothetical protein